MSTTQTAPDELKLGMAITNELSIPRYSANEISTRSMIPAADGVVEIGKAALTAQPEGQPVTEIDVKYVVFWRQEANRWKWHIDIWNANS